MTRMLDKYSRVRLSFKTDIATEQLILHDMHHAHVPLTQTLYSLFVCLLLHIVLQLDFFPKHIG